MNLFVWLEMVSVFFYGDLSPAILNLRMMMS